MTDSRASGSNRLETARAAGPQADSVPGSVVALAYDYPAGYRVGRHSHRRSQLVFAARGVMTVTTEEGRWVLPAQRALWVPAGVEHGIRTTGEVQFRTVYLATEVLAAHPATCEVLAVTSLLRELILRAVKVGPTLRTEDGACTSCALLDLLLEELAEARHAPLQMLHLPEGSDPRLRRLTAALRERPDDPATLGEWGRRVGASERTLARLFAAEMDLSFGRWRQQLRLQRALELLAAGRTVSQVALDVGYESLSAFITMFRQATGRTPTAYLSKEPDG